MSDFAIISAAISLGTVAFLLPAFFGLRDNFREWRGRIRELEKKVAELEARHDQ